MEQMDRKKRREKREKGETVKRHRIYQRVLYKIIKNKL